MQAGRLRHRVWIQKVTRTADATGQVVPTWANAPKGHVFADIQPLRGAEKIALQQIDPKTSHKIVMRYWAGLTPDEHRIRFIRMVGQTKTTRTFDINSVENFQEKNVKMVLYCTESL